MTELRFEDRSDFENADRGFIAKLDPGTVMSRDGRVVWDIDSYAFLSGDCPDTANPSPVAPRPAVRPPGPVCGDRRHLAGPGP
jgi:alkyl sulfatase BDS1-like metallo-beta-lactamase superfamily hydrolase